jgi:hypothetical protein
MDRPACYQLGDPGDLPPRGAGWEIDGAASCKAYGPDMDPPTDFPGDCRFCVRKERADRIRKGVIAPHQHRTGRKPKEAA